MTKVVRIDNSPQTQSKAVAILETDDQQRESNRVFSQTAHEDKTVQILNSDRVLAVPKNQEDVEEEELSEAHDVLHPLPEGWPKIPQLLQLQSWKFSTAVSPCVNQACSHLELLQNIIEEWFKQADSEAASRVSTTKGNYTGPSQASKDSNMRKHLRFDQTMASARKVSSAGQSSGLSSDIVSPDGSSPALYVKGVGGTEAEGMIESSTKYNLPYLGIDEVIEEVVTLLAKLESDRQETLIALRREKECVKMLARKIDDMCNKRLNDLPEAVQKEHEACSMNINELNWHVAYSGRNEARMQQRVAVAEALNLQLKEDIAFVTKHVPLVAEKLELEKDAMDRIYQAQVDTDDELALTRHRCSTVEAKSNEAMSKADAERLMIKKDLDAVKRELDDISEEYALATRTYENYIELCSEYTQKLKDNEQELLILEVKDENAKVADAMQAEKVKDIQAKIVQEQFQYRRLDDENCTMAREYDTKRNEYSHIERELEEMVAEKEETLKLTMRKNQELEMDTDDLTTKIKDCDRQKRSDEKNLERMAKEMERAKNQLESTQEDLSSVSVVNNAIRNQLRQEEEKCLQAEEALRSTMEALKRQIKEEMHSKTVLTARIASDSNELEKSKEDMVSKKEAAVMKVDEVESVVDSLQGKVAKLRAAHTDRGKMISDLKGELEEVDRQNNEFQKACDTKKSELLPVYNKLTEDLSVTDKRVEHMKWKTEQMNKKMEEMAASEKMMTRSINNTERQINELQEELDERNIKIETHQQIGDDLQSSLDVTDTRFKTLEKKHKEHMKHRQKILESHQDDLKANLKLNKELASKYRKLQNEYVVVKNKLLDKYDNRVNTENAIKDLRELKGLQKRMQSALLEYYKYRGLYNQQELEGMKAESSGNATKVLQLQADMNVALETITGFLRNQVSTGSSAKKPVAGKAAEKGARREKGQSGSKGQVTGPPTVTVR